jgi:hypothetical protein
MPYDVGRDVRAWAALARQLAAASSPAESAALTAAADAADGEDLAHAASRLAHGARELPAFEVRESLVDALPAIRSATPRIPSPRSEQETARGAVRVRFGQGVPASAKAMPAVTRRQQSRAAIWAAGLAAALVAFGIGAALWWWLG